MKKYLILFIGCLLFISNLIAQAPPSFIKDSLDTYVKRALTDWQIPGIAVCVVKDGKVVVMKGYGVKELGTTNKVDENTLFMIGSNSKAFTATALAMLAADKKLSLDDHVIKWLPDFKLYDPWVTKEANIRDLLCHRLGFETFQGDFMFFDSDLTLAEVREKFGQLKPMYSFRSRWGYCNAAFMTAGEIIPRVTGKSWATFLKDSLFTPLGMTNTLTLANDMKSAANKATAHTIDEGVLKKTRYGNIDALAPAGSISSSINDLSHWVMAQLNKGQYNNKQVIPAAALAQTWLPHSILGNGGHPFNKAHFSLYGLGWFLSEYEGKKLVEHTGGVNGFLTSVTLVPEEKLGIIVLTNSDDNKFFVSLKNEILDAYLGLPYRNYSGIDLAADRLEKQKNKAWLAEKKAAIANNNITQLPLVNYTGNYEHEVYGKMTITQENNKLVARFEHHKGRFAILEALGGDNFLATFNDPIYGVKDWVFTTTENGRVKSVRVMVAEFVEFTPYEFYKK
jgi:CubicO group peptidase (beta-lactamase class C family)